jgi:hypothetical protein
MVSGSAPGVRKSRPFSDFQALKIYRGDSMSLVQIEWSPVKKGLRDFGKAMLIGFGLIGLLFWWQVGFAACAWLWAFGAVAGVLGLTGTKAAMPFYWAWMGIAFVMGNIMSRVLVVLFYYGMITPFGLVMRLAGRDKLQLHAKGRDTYWHDIPPAPDKTRYERQF